MKRLMIVLSVGVIVALASAKAQASLATGTFTFGGTTTPTDQIGPWNMTSTDSTYAVLRLVVDQVFTFADITDLNFDYDSNVGGIGQGAPRAAVVFSDDSYIYIYWGPAGSFVDSTIGDGLNTGKLGGDDRFGPLRPLRSWRCLLLRPRYCTEFGGHEDSKPYLAGHRQLRR